MSGPMIMVVTIAVLFGFIILIAVADRLENWAGNFLARRGDVMKLVLFIPFAILWILFRLIDIFCIICGWYSLYSLANGARKWWNKREY